MYSVIDTIFHNLAVDACQDAFITWMLSRLCYHNLALDQLNRALEKSCLRFCSGRWIAENEVSI